jgi:hypothetical protein
MANKTRTTGVIEEGLIREIELIVCERQGDVNVEVGKVTDHWNFNPKATLQELKEAIDLILDKPGATLTVEEFANRFNYGHDVKERQEVKAGTREKTGVKAKVKKLEIALAESETKTQAIIGAARQRKIDGDPSLYDSLVHMGIIIE